MVPLTTPDELLMLRPGGSPEAVKSRALPAESVAETGK